MRRCSILVLVFFAGVFIGTLIAWMAWRKQHIEYELEPYSNASLKVFPGDSITLSPGGGVTNPLINVVGGNNYLCTSATPSKTCVIAKTSLPGPYALACSADGGVDCGDPGVQQSATAGKTNKYTFGEFLKIEIKVAVTGFAHIFGWEPFAVDNMQPTNEAGTHLAATSPPPPAYVACPPITNITELDNGGGKSLPPISVSGGQSVYWLDAQKFTISNIPPGLCSNSTFPTTWPVTKQAVCTIKQNPGTQVIKYQVQQITTGCSKSADLTLNVSN